MMKSLSMAGIPGALRMAEETRRLGHPQMCESICLDVLQSDAGNQKALKLLVLARTDQFGSDAVYASAAREAQQRLTSEYERAFYDAYILERTAQAAIAQGTASRTLYDLLTQAMASLEVAERIRPEGNDDAILLYNWCQRLLQATPHAGPRETQAFETMVGE